MNLHLNILDTKRQAILPLLKDFSKHGFYLAGGTGLALLLGHRDSIDFEFYKEGDFDTDILIENITKLFITHQLTVTQKEINSVSVLIDKKIQISFFGYHHSLLMPLVKSDYFDIATMLDIGCMKLSAITSHYVEKDYVDLYFILQNLPLPELLESFIKKYPNFDKTLIIKSLVYFDDLTEEPILFKENHNVSLETIKEFLRKTVKDYLK